MSFAIGDIPIEGEVFLAPMAGVSDSPYRSLTRRMGGGFSFNEFVSAEMLRARDEKTLAMLRFAAAERPVIFQLFGNSVESVREGAQVAMELEPDVIDLNMGCSVRHISGKGCGAGLLRDPGLAGAIIAELRRVLPVPVSAKIRLGWDEDSLNYLEVARVLEESGAAMISVHGRTRQQGYKGRADWESIGEIKSRANVPVLGNGDVTDYARARERRRSYGVDGVLIGRAALGDPWIFAGRDKRDVAPDEILDVMLGHLEAMLEHHESPHGLYMFRKHARAYLDSFVLDQARRRAILTAETDLEFRELIEALRDDAPRLVRRAA